LISKPKYFPRNLSVSFRPGDRVYEFLVVWQHEAGSMERILGVFSKHGVRVLMTHSQLDEETEAAVGTYYCDLARADQPVESLRNEIKALGFVRSVEYISTESTLFDRFLFPVMIWGRNRVLIMRLSPLLNIEKRLSEELGSAGSAIMFREGEGYAAETLGQYRAVLGSVSAESLLENVKDGLRATGWGLFEFKQTKEGYEVSVRETMLLEGTTEPSRFLCGIVAGIVESIYAIKVKVVESTVDPKSGRVHLRLAKIAEGRAPEAGSDHSGSA
jgi:hypothetical protein